jgi:chromate transporter
VSTEPEATPAQARPEVRTTHPGTAWEVFLVALRLGLTSFGGPIAHIGYFETEYVRRRRWVDEQTYADLVALSQSLPGAGSSKLGMSIGMIRAGLPGAFAAWIGFTLPSTIFMVVFALGVKGSGLADKGWLNGLLVVAVAVVALAVWNMATKLAPDIPRAALAIAATVIELTFPSRVTTVAIIIVAGVIGYTAFRQDAPSGRTERLVTLGRRPAIIAAVLFFALLGLLPLLRQATGSQAIALFDSHYRAGSLVFGGGTVVLPLLQSEVVTPGWVSQDQFLTGFGAAQAAPGPLFTFGAYLGAISGPSPHGITGALIALLGIFLPSILIVIATMPSFGAIRSRPGVQAMLRGVNAAVVGILLAALYDPLWTSTIRRPSDFSLALVAFGMLAIAKLPPWLVVIVVAAAGALIVAL